MLLSLTDGAAIDATLEALRCAWLRCGASTFIVRDAFV